MTIAERSCAVCGLTFEFEPRPGRPPMTCSPDCQRARKSAQTEESRTRHASLDVPDDKHGTATGYTFYKCDCDECARWARLYKQERRTGGVRIRREHTRARRRQRGA